MKAIERFYQYLDSKGIKPTRFEKDNGLSNGYLGTQLKRNGNLGEDVINKIINNCLDIDPVWLLTGNGSMTKSIPYLENSDANGAHLLTEPESTFEKETKIIHKQSVPLYDVHAAVSVSALFENENSEKPVDYITIPNLPKCDGAIYISGDSMDPLLKSGDIIIYKKLANTIENIYWGDMYLISLMTEDDELVMVKWIHKSEKGEGFIKLTSENKHHEPKDFPITAIKGLALIKATIRINSMY